MPRGQGGGRPRVDEKNIKLFLDYIEAGNSIRASAGAARISKAVIYKMMRLGEVDQAAKRRTKFAKFMDSFEHSRAKAETNYVTIVASGAAGDSGKGIKPDTSDAKFMLAHINSRRWADRRRIDINGDTPIDRADLLRGVQELAKAVRDEVEDPEILKRIDARWEDIIESWRGHAERKRKSRVVGDELEEIVIEERRALPPASNGHEPETPQ